jgi:hypothetical protein
MRFFGGNGCSDFLTSYDWSRPMRILGRPKIYIYWVEIINSPLQNGYHLPTHYNSSR